MTASVRRRMAFTLVANLLRSLLSFATGVLLARWLGPESFGRMAFLLGTFLALRQFLDMGSASAFFTFVSQRPQSRRFVNAFFAWMGLQFLIPLCFIGLLFPAQWIDAIWRGEHRGLVVLAFVAAFMQNSLWPVVQQAAEAQRQTLRVQSVGVAVAFVHLSAVTLFWVFGELGLYAVFVAVALEYLVGAALVRRTFTYGEAQPVEAEEIARPLLRQYLRYCLPLIPFTWIGFLYEFTDRWLLQTYGGGVEQAYYAVGAQFGAIALIATTSILSVFWKEIAEAHYRGDESRTRMLYQRVSRLLFFAGACLAGFLVPWAEQLLNLLVGAAYAGGALTLAIMFLYPVHQSMGQIGSAMLYATERVSVQVGVGIVFMIVSMLVTYFVLAPPEAAIPGLGLASEGLAVKMVLLQMIQVNVIAYIICRLWKWPFEWIHQPGSLLVCAVSGWLAHGAASYLSGAAWPVVPSMALGAALYLSLMLAFIFAAPQLIGFTRNGLMTEAGAMIRLAGAGFRSR